MIDLEPAAPIVPADLPRWSARVRHGADADARDRAVTTIGSLQVFDAASGSEVFRFDSAGRPSAVVFDGYLFDQSDLEAELGLPPSSPAAVACAAFRRWGRELFDHLDGCYLVAVWDGAAGRLLLGHDALGRHPVYYANEPDGFWFGSNILSLVAAGSIPRTPNRLSLALGLLAFWPAAGETSFARVRRLGPGHLLTWMPGEEPSERAYWDPLPGDDEPWMPDDEAVEGFEPALMEAVARCMSLKPTGIMLSGGVDSVSVAVLAALWWRAHGTPPITAVSGQTGYGVPTGEELAQARVASALGMRHLVSTTAEWRAGRDSIVLSLEAVRDLPSPSRVWVGTYMQFYRRTATQQLRVLLTGAGGDNWLGVAHPHAADLLGSLRLVHLWRFIRTNTSTGGSTWRGAVRNLLWRHGVRPHLDSAWALFAPASKDSYHRRRWSERLPPWLCPDAELRGELMEALLGRRTPPLTAAGHFPRSYYRHALRTLTNPYMHYENEVAFHVERLCGLCLLSPYHDRRLVSFLNRVSPRALVHGNRSKGLLRPLMTKYLPHLGLERQRKDDGREEVERLRMMRDGIATSWQRFHFERLGALGLVDRSAVRALSEGVDRKTMRQLGPMQIVMSSERWLETHANV